MLYEPKTKLEILKTSKYIYKNIMSEIDIINSTIESYKPNTMRELRRILRENFDIDDNLVGKYSRGIPTLITISLDYNDNDFNRAFLNWRIRNIFINIEPLEISYCTSSTGTLQLKDNVLNDYDDKITDGYEEFSIMYICKENENIPSIRYLEPELFFLNDGEEEDT